MVLTSEPHRTMFLGVCNPHKDQVLIAWVISTKPMKVFFLNFKFFCCSQVLGIVWVLGCSF